MLCFPNMSCISVIKVDDFDAAVRGRSFLDKKKRWKDEKWHFSKLFFLIQLYFCDRARPSFQLPSGGTMFTELQPFYSNAAELNRWTSRHSLFSSSISPSSGCLNDGIFALKTVFYFLHSELLFYSVMSLLQFINIRNKLRWLEWIYVSLQRPF